MADKKTATKKQAKEKKLVPMSSLDQKKYELRKQGLDVRFKSGGIASGIRRFNRGGKV